MARAVEEHRWIALGRYIHTALSGSAVGTRRSCDWQQGQNPGNMAGVQCGTIYGEALSCCTPSPWAGFLWHGALDATRHPAEQASHWSWPPSGCAGALAVVAQCPSGSGNPDGWARNVRKPLPAAALDTQRIQAAGEGEEGWAAVATLQFAGDGTYLGTSLRR